MRKQISVIYFICVVSAAAFLAYLCLFARNKMFELRLPGNYIKLESHDFVEKKDMDAPAGIRDVCIVKPEEIPNGSNALIFQSAHQNVEVYIANKLAFSLKKDTGSSVGKSPGHRWNTIPLSSKDWEKEIRLEFSPAYESKAGAIPDLYIGSQFWIFADIVKQNLTAVLLSVLAMIMGIAFMAFAVYTGRNLAMDKSLSMMGLFALLVGTWKLTDTGMVALFFGHELIMSYIPFLALLLVVVPYTQYIRDLFSTKDWKIWDVVCIASLAVCLYSLGVQALGISDLREVLWMNHLTMLLLVCVTLPMLYLEVHRIGWNRKLKAMVICMGACLIGFAADIFIYYLSGGISATNIGMTCFLIYITVLGLMSLQDAKQLMSIGLQAQHLEQMAYHDQLTGLYNRAAYADYTGQEDFAPKGNIVIMLDLNDLKHCNDTYGHEKGDLYITSSAALIQQIFGSDGKCYRMGGDEFCVLLKHNSEKECEKMLQQLKKNTKEWNEAHDEKFQIQIASGFALYDGELDYDIGDTLRRADKMMYREKYEMKQGRAKLARE